MQRERNGALWGIGAYVIWGVMPIYWKVLGHVGSFEILVSRIIWASVLTTLLVVFMRNGRNLISDFRTLWQSKRQFWSLFFASTLMSGNWFLYIWAVNHGHIIQTSLGYYINPLVSVLLGIFFLKERLSYSQQVAFLLATVGVVILTFSYGHVPWLSLALAISFAVYGLVKKQIQLDAIRGLAIETLFILPFAMVAYGWLFFHSPTAFLQVDVKTDILLVLTGVATGLPLILFVKGAQTMPLYMVGFLQYIAPTLMLIIGVSIYGEKFESIDLLSFSFIWAALILFAVSKIAEVIQQKKAATH
ncbi:EamA family transporter RarD [Sporosarcina sp. 179-K 3D1 HS]|uniref:EamA family transporter RarD n=1 Tax=Sporosarcina sp. 179-K 3D1 HS TaxID=3232169 RepID=UPI0039A358A8